MKRFFLFMVALMFSVGAWAQKLPGKAAELLPTLVMEQSTYWPGLSEPAYIAGLIDQESGWKPTATLRTSREWGCGLGQFTVTYNKDGSVRFDAIAETKRLDKSLANWNWQDCSNVRYQMRASILKSKQNDRNCSVWMKDSHNALACNGSGYNGGMGGVSLRIRMCRAKPGCDPKVWEGNLEKQCTASTTKVAGYGESFCEINSKYPGRIFNRMPKFDKAIKDIRNHL